MVKRSLTISEILENADNYNCTVSQAQGQPLQEVDRRLFSTHVWFTTSALVWSMRPRGTASYTYVAVQVQVTHARILVAGTGRDVPPPSRPVPCFSNVHYGNLEVKLLPKLKYYNQRNS